MLRLLPVDRLPVEPGSLQERDHLARQRIALAGDRSELVLKVRVGAVVAGITALERLSRRLQAGESEFTDRGVDPLVHLRQGGEAPALLHSGGSRPSGEVLGQRSPVTVVVVLQ